MIVENLRTYHMGRYFIVKLIGLDITYYLDPGEPGIEFVRGVLFDWDMDCSVNIPYSGSWYLRKEHFEVWSKMSKVTGVAQGE